jgi:ABC-2 type transport system ATP-binding protein
MSDAIVIDGLSKKYGDVFAVRDIRFGVPEGEIYGFLGHNGAGKTTTLKMLLGLAKPTEGKASVLGLDPAKDPLAVRRVTGFLPASYALPGDSTAREFLLYVAAMFGLSGRAARDRVEPLLELFGLASVADRKLRAFSTGMAQKVGLAQALVNDPRVLLLDEPTTGLDPLGRHELLEHLRRLSREKGVTVLFSSHILSDIEAICERAAVLHQGRMLAAGTLEALQERANARGMDAMYLALVRGAS